MEIIMKVKCSPNPGAGPTTTTHSSLKIVDHHRQLQQHTGGYSKTSTPPQITTYIPPNSHTECPLSSSSCSECTVGYCCNLPTCCITTPPTAHQTLPTPPPLLPLQSDSYASINVGQPQQPTEEQPEFVSIDDEKVKQYLMKFGQQHLEQQRKRYQKETRVTRIFSAPTVEPRSRPVIYEIIELDDEGEREKLKQIKQQAEQSLAIRKSTPCVDINYAARQTKSLNISLIPKPAETQPCQQQTSLKSSPQSRGASNNEQKIIAEINLIDSSDEDTSMDEDDEDETLPLAAVSCELECDDDDEDHSFPPSPSQYDNFRISNPHTVISKQSQNNEIAGLSAKEHLMVRWEEYEGQRERVFFECFLCGKKVQSSYNLRRHMMIHTGERPFACDMCDRRFREFSDLKKHRRRHSNEPNFICMVCRELPPIENDPTRCIKCCTQSKNAVLVAAMKMTDEDNNATTEIDTSQQSEPESDANKSSHFTSTPSTSSATLSLPNYTSLTPPSITITSANFTTVRSRSPTANNATKTSPAPLGNSTEDTQRLLDNIPAVHRPGYNQLGMITRKEFPCPLCNRAFGTRHNLKRHYMIHTGEKPFNCSKCRKPFREYSTLKKHMVTHQRDRWYKCMRCPLKFRDFLKYTEHKESHPQDDDETDEGSPSKTQNKFQSSDSYMDSNDEDSNSDDWLECCECGQRFNEIDSYNEHLKEHDSSSQIYQCYICKERFEVRSALEKHLTTHKQDTDSDGDVIE